MALNERFIDEPRPLRLAIIGGGLAGILAGILLPAKVPALTLVIYEKNEDFVRKMEQPSCGNFICILTLHREELGLKMCIQAYGATLHRTYTNRLSPLKQIGLPRTRQVARYVITGKVLHEITMCIASPDLITGLRQHHGMPQQVCGN